MKKHKLIKSLLFAPLASIPLVAAVGCGSSNPKIDAQDAAANALVSKFNDAKNFVSITNSDQNKAYSNFVFSTSATDKSQTLTKKSFIHILTTPETKSTTNGDTTTYTYDGAGTPYLYIWAQLKLQDPDGKKGETKPVDVVVAEFNENFKVVVNNQSKTIGAGKVTFTGYEKGKELEQFKMATADNNFYIANMLYAFSVNANKSSDAMSIADYKASVEKISSTSAVFDATSVFESSDATTLEYDTKQADPAIVYTAKAAGAEFDTTILAKDTDTFKSLEYNLNLTTGKLTIKAPAVVTIT